MTKHVVLLIEDELDSAEATSELLEGLDFGVVHAGSAQEAHPIIDAGTFCFAIVDLQMKAKPGSAEPRVDVGQCLVEYIRTRYPARNEKDKHFLQILVMSGHAREPQHMIRAFQDRADDFIFKALDDNAVSFRDKVRNAIRHSGRDKHDDCPTIMKRATKVMLAAGALPGLRIAIPGASKGQKTEITIDGRSVLIPIASFLVLLTLVAARLDSDEWVSSKEHGAGEEGWRQASRLREELEKHAGKGARALIENDGAGSYRLHSDVTVGAIDWARLAKHSDARIRAIATKRTK